MKTYRLFKPILLTNNAAEQLGVNNRIYQVGELMEFPDAMAKAWLLNGTIEVYEPPLPPAPEPVKKPAKKTPAKSAAKTEEAK
jgi:hypothetical protein